MTGVGKIEIRLLGTGDAQVLANVSEDLFDNSIDSNLVEELLSDPRHHLAVAIDEGVVVGFVSGVHYVHPDKRAQMFVNEVSTAASHRRGGIGRALLGALFDHARGLGCSEGWVLTDHGNSAARGLYGGLGGEPTEAVVMFTFPLDRGP